MIGMLRLLDHYQYWNEILLQFGVHALIALCQNGGLGSFRFENHEIPSLGRSRLVDK
jgi:hypothetical protein